MKLSGYSLSTEQLQLRQLARQIAVKYLVPRADETEKAGSLFPPDVLEVLRRHDLLGLDIPVEFGGQGLDTLSCAVISEELSRGWFAAASYAMALAAGPILFAGTKAQKEKYLPGIATGRLVTAFALTEADGGSDAASLKTRARRDGDSYHIDGTKVFITNASVADVFVTFARTDTQAPRGKGISVFLVDKNTPGLRIGRRFETLAHGANAISEVIYDDCVIPRENLIGEEGEGFEYVRVGFAKTRAVYGARCAGVAQAALDYVASYAQERTQFGQPIGQFQGIRFKLADMATQIEAARHLSYRAATLVDQASEEAPVAAAMAKHFASNVAMEATTEAIQVMGGHGYLRDHPVERYFREAKLFQIGDGTSEVLRILISRHLRKQIQAGRSACLSAS